MGFTPRASDGQLDIPVLTRRGGRKKSCARRISYPHEGRSVIGSDT